MSYRGEKVAASMQEYLKSEHAHAMADIASVLSQHPLREKHFEQARACMEAKIGMLKETICSRLKDNADKNQCVALRDRRLEFQHVFMATNNDGDEFIPLGQQIFLRQDNLSILSRFFPVHLYSDHLEYRYAQRAAKALNFGERSFVSALSFSLFLLKALELVTPKESPGEVPIVIPQPRGLFLGTAQRGPTDLYRPISAISITYNAKTESDEVIEGKATWVPKNAIIIKTFIPSIDYLRSRKILHLALNDLDEAFTGCNIHHHNIESYLLGTDTMLSPPEKAALKTYTHKLAELIQSQVWKEGTTSAAPRRPRASASASSSTENGEAVPQPS